MKNPAPLVGWILMIAAIAGTVVLGTLPAPYVLESPGPVYDTIGEIDIAGESTPVIEVDGEKTYPTSGTLDMLTVTLRGSRADAAELDRPRRSPGSIRTRAVLPIEVVYPEGADRRAVETSRAPPTWSTRSRRPWPPRWASSTSTTPASSRSARPLDGFPADGVLEARRPDPHGRRRPDRRRHRAERRARRAAGRLHVRARHRPRRRRADRRTDHRGLAGRPRQARSSASRRARPTTSRSTSPSTSATSAGPAPARCSRSASTTSSRPAS